MESVVTRFVVVTGTDTGVGKTFVTEALALALARDREVVAIKPLESGLDAEDGDGERLAAATGQAEPRHALVRLRAPLAPALAADREGRTIDFDALVREIRAHAAGKDVALVEGAGGVLAPLTWDHDAVSLARALGAGVVLVAADRLGTISLSHAAAHVLAAAGVAPIAIVLSAPAIPDASTGSNAAALVRRLAVPADRVLEVTRTEVADASRQLAPLARRLAG